MTISTIMACVFGWLLTMAVVSPLPFLLVRWFFQLKKKIKS